MTALIKAGSMLRAVSTARLNALASHPGTPSPHLNDARAVNMYCPSGNWGIRWASTAWTSASTNGSTPLGVPAVPFEYGTLAPGLAGGAAVTFPNDKFVKVSLAKAVAPPAGRKLLVGTFPNVSPANEPTLTADPNIAGATGPAAAYVAAALTSSST